MNTYLIYGLENYLIDEKIKEIKNKTKVVDDNIISYDLNNDSISSVLVEASTVSMFSEKKLIICDNSQFLTANKSLSEDELGELTKYLDNSFEDVFIIFIVRDEKVDSRKKITKLITKVSKVYECNKIESYRLSNYISDYIR